MQPTPPLFRQRNPLAEQLRRSLCVFKLHAPADVAYGAIVPPSLRAACARIDAQLDLERHAHGTTLTLTASHATVDAFGGMHLLASSGALAVACAAPPERAGSAGAFRYRHSVRACERSDGARTHTQRTIASILTALGPLAGERVALVVSKDDPARIDDRTFLGNSLVFLEMTRLELAELAGGSKEAWRIALAQRSDRVRAIAERRASALQRGAAEGCLTFSSVGDVARIPWARALDPSRFEMVPTPAAPDGATLVLWGRGASQALTLCTAPDAPLARAYPVVRDAWERSLS